jgi:hypothetical protein
LARHCDGGRRWIVILVLERAGLIAFNAHVSLPIDLPLEDGHAPESVRMSCHLALREDHQRRSMGAGWRGNVIDRY